jgi:hypothetical protein
MFDTPILFLAYNRPADTRKVFTAIRAIKPKKLFVAVDGPNPKNHKDLENCRAVQDIVTDINWDCDFQTLFATRNHGCKVAVSQAIDWFFDHIDRGIIIEDDCLPNPSFFPFCSELLERYHNDNRIMTVSGSNLLHTHTNGPYSYYFSKFMLCWGWATWRRAWKYYDIKMRLWPEIRDQKRLDDIFDSSRKVNLNSKIYQRVYMNEIDSWAIRWSFAVLIQNGVNIIPHVNLVSNIGFGKEATHTNDCSSPSANIPFQTIESRLAHPPHVIVDKNADNIVFKRHIAGKSLPVKILKSAVTHLQRFNPLSSITNND